MSEVTTYQDAAQRIKELEAEVAAKDDLLRLALPIVRRDDFKSSESLAEEIDKALSTTTGAQLLDDLHELRRLLDCRAGKLLQQGKYFIVVSETEPYFSSVYDVIRLFEGAKGTWNDEDELVYQDKISNIRSDEFSLETLKLIVKLKHENIKLTERIKKGEELYCAIITSKSDLDNQILKALAIYRKATIEQEVEQVLSAYRATCEGGEGMSKIERPKHIWALRFVDDTDHAIRTGLVSALDDDGATNFLAFATKKDAEKGAKHQLDTYEINCYPVKLK